MIPKRVAWSPGAGRKMTLRYDSRDSSAVRKAALVRALDVANQITFADTASKGGVEKTIHLVDPEGRQVEEQALFHTALRELVLVKPIRFLGSDSTTASISTPEPCSSTLHDRNSL